MAAQSLGASAPALVFHDIHFSPLVRDGQLWLTAAEIASALGYERDTFVNRIYSRHADEFSAQMTGVVKLTTPGGAQEARVFSLRGAHAIGFFARTERAKEFRRWVLDVLDREIACAIPVVDLRDENRSANSTPTVPLPPAVRRVLERKAWELTRESYELCCEYLERRVAYKCEVGWPERRIDVARAREVIACTTLDMVLAPRHYCSLEAIMMLAGILSKRAGGLLGEMSQKIAREMRH